MKGLLRIGPLLPAANPHRGQDAGLEDEVAVEAPLAVATMRRHARARS